MYRSNTLVSSTPPAARSRLIITRITFDNYTSYSILQYLRCALGSYLY